MVENISIKEDEILVLPDMKLAWCNFCWKDTPTVNETDCDICKLSKTNHELDKLVAQDHIETEDIL